MANHWITAIAVFAILGLGLIFDELPRGADRSFVEGLHVSLGVLALPLIAWRVFWRLQYGSPDPIPGPRWQHAVAKLVSIVLLAGLVVLALSGLLAVWATGNPISVFDWFQLASPLPADRFLMEALEEIHEFASDTFMIAVAVHIAAAAKRAVIDKDGTLRRMLRVAG